MQFDPPHEPDEQATAGSSSPGVPQADSNATHKFVSFFLNEKQYAIPAHSVAEVAGRLSPIRLPDAPAAMLGIAPLRGDILAVVEAGASSSAAHPAKQKAVVLRPMDRDVEVPVAFNVDRLGELLQIRAADIRVSSQNDRLAEFESNADGRSVLVVDPARIHNLLSDPAQ